MSIMETVLRMRAALLGEPSPTQAKIYVGRAARRRARYGSRSRTPGRPRRASSPGALPMFIAISRRKDGLGRRYHQCTTRDQAITHHPYMIEHVNGWGQVTLRERLS